MPLTRQISHLPVLSFRSVVGSSLSSSSICSKRFEDFDFGSLPGPAPSLVKREEMASFNFHILLWPFSKGALPVRSVSFASENFVTCGRGKEGEAGKFGEDGLRPFKALMKLRPGSLGGMGACGAKATCTLLALLLLMEVVRSGT